ACQQPPEGPLAAAAISLGLVEAMTAAKALLQSLFPPDPWPVLRRSRTSPLLPGRRAPEPAPGFLEGTLRIAEKGLRGRQRGEETFLTPLWARLERRMAPGERNRELFRTGGIDALLRATVHSM